MKQALLKINGCFSFCNVTMIETSPSKWYKGENCWLKAILILKQVILGLKL